MVQYRYLFADLLTNDIIAELSLTNVNFSQALNSSGAFQADILLSGVPVTANVMPATIPGRNCVYVDRDGVLVWGGVIWSRTYDSTEQTLKIAAEEFESYWAHRRITADAVFDNVDQLTVAGSLIDTAQSVASGDIGVIVPNITSGVTISRTYYGYEQKTVLAAIQDLAKAGDGSTGQTGFDFAIDVDYSDTFEPLKTLTLGYPRLGTAYVEGDPNVPVFEFPAGNVISYSYPEDGSVVSNVVYVTGAGSNEGKIIYSATDTNKLLQGWPLLEESTSYSDIVDETVLQNLAVGQVAAVSYPPTVLNIVANPATDPVFGSYRIGDDARIRINDARFPNTLDTVYRITALSVTPGETGPEEITLTLNLPTTAVA